MWAGIVFQTLPSASSVMPIWSWHTSTTLDTMSLRIVRLLLVSAAPASTTSASSRPTFFVGWLAWAGAELR